MALALSIVFGYPSRYLCPRLCPGACIYRSHDDGTHSFFDMDIEDIDRFIARRDPTIIRHLCFNLRVPSMDGDDGIINRHAFTTVSLEFKKVSAVNVKDLWQTLRGHQKAIAFLRESGCLAPDVVDYIEKKLWECLDPLSKKRMMVMVMRMMKHICLKHAETYWNPDYVWKTGPNAGRKTMDVLIERAGLVGLVAHVG